MIDSFGKLQELDYADVAVWCVCRLGNILHGTHTYKAAYIKEIDKEMNKYTVSIILVDENGKEEDRDIGHDNFALTRNEAAKVLKAVERVAYCYNKLTDDGYRLLFSSGAVKK